MIRHCALPVLRMQRWSHILQSDQGLHTLPALALLTSSALPALERRLVSAGGDPRYALPTSAPYQRCGPTHTAPYKHVVRRCHLLRLTSAECYSRAALDQCLTSTPPAPAKALTTTTPYQRWPARPAAPYLCITSALAVCYEHFAATSVGSALQGCIRSALPAVYQHGVRR